MLSVILYGRNDDHGYNYHKRLAISLNCIAEVLSDPSDEIVFVDYNTPDELPTIVEAIQDTLTLKAKALLRILRIRPTQHARFSKETSLPLLEPVARNVAICRTHPENKWILSTNVDMVFVPQQQGKSLTDIVAGLKDGFYSLPRFELPENFWELSLERSNPSANISFLREQSSRLHLDTIIRKEGFIKYDNPGDFQLMLKKDIMEMRGFDEQMLKGWHVDSNLCKRMSIANKEGPSIERLLKCYHCNHTYKESFLHSQNRTQNDWHRFVDSEAIQPILSQPDWGLAKEEIEEIRLDASSSHTHLKVLLSCLQKTEAREYELVVNPSSYNRLTYSPSRIFTYLSDHLCNLPDQTHIGYIGCNHDLICKLKDYLETRQRKGKIFCLEGLFEPEAVLPSPAILSDLSMILSNASLFIFDFGVDEDSGLGRKITQSNEGYRLARQRIKKVMHSFFRAVQQARALHLRSKFIGIHVNYTDFNLIFSRHLSTRLNSYITGISYGYLPRKKAKRPRITLSSMKKKMLLSVRYAIARYLFNYSDPIRRFILRTKLSKIL